MTDQGPGFNAWTGGGPVEGLPKQVDEVSEPTSVTGPVEGARQP